MIIFVALISAFDQTLVEDKSVNRLVGSTPRFHRAASDFVAIPGRLGHPMEGCVLEQAAREGGADPIHE